MSNQAKYVNPPRTMAEKYAAIYGTNKKASSGLKKGGASTSKRNDVVDQSSAVEAKQNKHAAIHGTVPMDIDSSVGGPIKRTNTTTKTLQWTKLNQREKLERAREWAQEQRYEKKRIAAVRTGGVDGGKTTTCRQYSGLAAETGNHTTLASQSIKQSQRVKLERAREWAEEQRNEKEHLSATQVTRPRTAGGKSTGISTCTRQTVVQQQCTLAAEPGGISLQISIDGGTWDDIVQATKQE